METKLSNTDMSKFLDGMEEYADAVKNGTATGEDLAKAFGVGGLSESEETNESNEEDFRADFVGV